VLVAVGRGADWLAWTNKEGGIALADLGGTGILDLSGVMVALPPGRIKRTTDRADLDGGGAVPADGHPGSRWPDGSPGNNQEWQ